MNEQEFIQSIDCCFPYLEEERWKQIVELGVGLSSNAAFMVLHEICRPSHSSGVAPDQLKGIAKHWFDRFDHPLKNRLYEIALKRIDRQELSVAEVLDHFKEIQKFRDQYNALAIAYFACDDVEGQIEDPYEEIVRGWQSD